MTKCSQLPRHLIKDDIIARDEAVYVPAVSPGFAQDVHKQGWQRPLPKGVAPTDMDFLNPKTRLCRISHALTSAGQALDQRAPCIITERDRKHTLVIADSGGYQVASGRLVIKNDKTRLRILQWQERTADVAMTLDVPPAAALTGRSFKDCLTATLENLRFYQKHRKADIIFLNVLQGNSPEECDEWYAAVKDEFECEGFAFAGPLRHNMYELCRRLLMMIDEGRLGKMTWIHVLGTGQLEAAVLLTAVQNAINKYVNRDLRVSYDTSSPFRNLAWNKAFTIPAFDAKGMTMPTREAPDGPEFVGSEVPWPWRSALGDRMIMGDFCVPMPGRARRYRDTQSNHYLAHHNAHALCEAIALANRIFRVERLNGNHTIAPGVGKAAAAIDRIFGTQSSAELMKSRTLFNSLRYVKAYDNSEENRDI